MDNSRRLPAESNLPQAPKSLNGAFVPQSVTGVRELLDEFALEGVHYGLQPSARPELLIDVVQVIA